MTRAVLSLLALALLACGPPTTSGGDGGAPSLSTTETSSTGPYWAPCDAPLPFGTAPSCNVATFCNAGTLCPAFQYCDTRPNRGQCADPHGCPEGTCYLQGHVGDPCLEDVWCLEACGLGCDVNSYTCTVVDPSKAQGCPQ